MRMQRKSRSRRHMVFIDDAQRTKSHPLRIVILIERKSMLGIQPAIIATAAFLASPYVNHDVISLLINSTTYRCLDKKRDSTRGEARRIQVELTLIAVRSR